MVLDICPENHTDHGGIEPTSTDVEMVRRDDKFWCDIMMDGSLLEESKTLTRSVHYSSDAIHGMYTILGLTVRGTAVATGLLTGDVCNDRGKSLYGGPTDRHLY